MESTKLRKQVQKNEKDILLLKEGLENIELVASNVTMSDGTTVEDSILSLQNQIGGQVIRAKNILTNLSNKVE